MLTFSHSVGYRGWFEIGTVLDNWYVSSDVNNYSSSSGSGSMFLCTGGNISLTQEPIMGTGVWGAGYMNVAPISYAYNYLSLEGSSNFELTSDLRGWDRLSSAVRERTRPLFVTLLPDGVNGFRGGAWMTSFGLENSEGAAVTGTFSFKGDPAGKVTYDSKVNHAIVASGEKHSWFSSSDWQRWGSNSDYANSSLAGGTLIPYWRTGMGFDGLQSSTWSSLSLGHLGMPASLIGSFPTYSSHSSDLTIPIGSTTSSNPELVTTAKHLFSDVISWSVNYNSDLQMLKCCRYETFSPLSADYILCGEATCDGSYTIFRVAGDFSPGAYHKRRRNMTFLINGNKQQYEGDGSTGAQYYKNSSNVLYVVVPQVLISSGSTSMTSGAQYVSTEFSFTALGNGKSAIMVMDRDGRSS